MRFTLTTVLGDIITRAKGKGGGGYNISTGQITHPTYGSGRKAPVVKGKTKITRTPKQK